ncbi:alpha/beta fold hydrolase [Psychroserpens sp. XS_ASV72]|uniref:alpha/beta fold hydrolase n=1 Tax=Psychroserpens sp. XS_ASV72 TaxID=3241293 RepID=UPI003512B013
MTLTHKNIPVYYTDEGQGTTMVLLHGFLENSSMWNDLKTELTPNYRLVCIDLLGHGQTGCLGYVHTMDEMAETVKAVLDELKIKRCTLFGHSMGGYVALAFADLFPKYLEGLSLVNSTPAADSEERKTNRDRAIEAVKQNHKTFVRISVANLFAPYNKDNFAEAIENVIQEALQTPVQGIVAALEGMKSRPNRTHVLKSLPVKKQLVIGQHDPVLNYDEVMSQVQDIDMIIDEFPDGHMSHIENKEEFTYKIKRFIEK